MPRNIRLKKPPEGYFWRIEKKNHYPWDDEAVLYRKVLVKSWGFPSTVIKSVGSVNLTMHGYAPGTTPTDEEKADTIFRLSEIEVEFEYRKNNIGEYSIELVD